MTGELFKINEHGDIWQEPTLFDQGGENVTSSCADEHRAALEQHAELLSWTPEDIAGAVVTAADNAQGELLDYRDDLPPRRLPNGLTRAELRDYIRNGPRR